jgi:hypothetical protein
MCRRQQEPAIVVHEPCSLADPARQHDRNRRARPLYQVRQPLRTTDPDQKAGHEKRY